MKSPTKGKAAPKPKAKPPNAHVPTDASREQVRKLAGLFLTLDHIALIMGLGSKNTLIKHYRDVLDVGMAQADAKVGEALVSHLVGRPAEFDDEGNQTKSELIPDRSVAIWLSKARLGMREVREYRQPLADAYDLKKLTTEELQALDALLTKAEKPKKGEVANDDADSDDPPRVVREGTRRTHKFRTRRT